MEDWEPRIWCDLYKEVGWPKNWSLCSLGSQLIHLFCFLSEHISYLCTSIVAIPYPKKIFSQSIIHLALPSVETLRPVYCDVILTISIWIRVELLVVLKMSHFKTDLVFMMWFTVLCGWLVKPSCISPVDFLKDWKNGCLKSVVICTRIGEENCSLCSLGKWLTYMFSFLSQHISYLCMSILVIPYPRKNLIPKRVIHFGLPSDGKTKSTIVKCYSYSYHFGSELKYF